MERHLGVILNAFHRKWQELLNRKKGERLKKIICIYGKTMRSNRRKNLKRLNGIGTCKSTVTEKGETAKAISYSIYSRTGKGAGNAAENVNILHHIGINPLKQEKSCKLVIASKRKK